MKQIFVSVILAVAAAAFVSCAKTETDDFNVIEQEALDVWIEKNAPEAKPLGDTGMYYEVIGDGAAAKSKVDVKGKWVELNYVMRNLDGDVVYSRSEKTARQLGTYNAYTHYVADRLYIATQAGKSGIPRGIYEAITSIAPGDMWKVYIPSRLAFSTTGYKITTGYGGQKGLEANVPMILDSLQILNIIDNPELQALDDVDRLASSDKPEGWGMLKNDTVKKGIYLDVMRRISEKDTIALNQSATIYYKVRFLDGQLINTNVDSVFYNNFGVVRTQDKTSKLNITRVKEGNTVYNANQVPARVFYAILPELRYGDIGRVVATPIYAYGKSYLRPDKTETAWDISTAFTLDVIEYSKFASLDTDSYFGSSTFYIPYSNGTTAPVATAEIKPYTPLIFEFTVRVNGD